MLSSVNSSRYKNGRKSSKRLIDSETLPLPPCRDGKNWDDCWTLGKYGKLGWMWCIDKVYKDYLQNHICIYIYIYISTCQWWTLGKSRPHDTDQGSHCFTKSIGSLVIFQKGSRTPGPWGARIENTFDVELSQQSELYMICFLLDPIYPIVIVPAPEMAT